MRIIVILFGILVALILLGWLGLQIEPAPFPAFPEQALRLETTPLPDGLPAPVERFYRKIYGEKVPVIKSAVVTGRAQMRVRGITFPARFRFTHIAGQDYRHYIEATFFGLPLLKVNENYLDGKSRLELPFGVVENEPKVNQAANWACGPSPYGCRRSSSPIHACAGTAAAPLARRRDLPEMRDN